jgi:hypothetical protein
MYKIIFYCAKNNLRFSSLFQIANTLKMNRLIIYLKNQITNNFCAVPLCLSLLILLGVSCQKDYIT